MSANETVTFDGDGGNLVIEFDTNEYGWSKCYLDLVDHQRTYLGAGTIGYIVTRLLNGLIDMAWEFREDSSGHISGAPVWWVLSLSEAHHALYANEDNQNLKLYWQNAHQAPVKIVGEITLTPLQRTKWRDRLGSLRSEYKGTKKWLYRDPPTTYRIK